MAQTTNLQTPELQKEFYDRYMQRVKQEAMGLTGEENSADQLTQAVFEAAYAHFETRTMPQNCEMYLLSRTNLLYAKDMDAYTKVETVAPVEKPVVMQQEAAPVVADIPEPVVHQQGSVVKPMRSRKRAAMNAVQESQSEVLQSQEPSAIHSGLVKSTMGMAPATFGVASTTQMASSVVEAVPEIPPMPQIVVDNEKQEPVEETKPSVRAVPSRNVQELNTQDPLIYDQKQTMHWTPEMEVSTASIAATKSEEEDESMRRSVPLTILNTLLFILTVVAFGFLLYELDVFSLFF